MTFEVGGETFVVCITPATLRQGERVYQRTYQQAVSAGFMSRKRVKAAIARLWTEEKQARRSEILDAIQADEQLLQCDRLSLTDGLAAAVRLRERRAELRVLCAEVASLEEQCAEGRALQAQFEFIVAASTFKNNARVFADAAALEQGGPAAKKAQWVVAGVLCSVQEDYEQLLPEAVFLATHASPAQAA